MAPGCLFNFICSHHADIENSSHGVRSFSGMAASDPLRKIANLSTWSAGVAHGRLFVFENLATRLAVRVIPHSDVCLTWLYDKTFQLYAPCLQTNVLTLISFQLPAIAHFELSEETSRRRSRSFREITPGGYVR